MSIVFLSCFPAKYLSWLFRKEPLGVYRYVRIVLMLLSGFLLNTLIQPNADTKKLEKHVFLICAAPKLLFKTLPSLAHLFHNSTSWSARCLYCFAPRRRF